MLSSLLKLPVNPLSKLTGCHANRRITGSFNKVIGKERRAIILGINRMTRIEVVLMVTGKV